MPCGIAHGPSAVAPGSAGPHHPDGQKPQPRDCLHALDPADGEQSAHYLQLMCSCGSSISGAWNTGVGHAVLSSHDRNKAPPKSGLQCRKLWHLGDHSWFPIITLVAWHLTHWALTWHRVHGSAGFISWPPEGEMEPPPPQVLSSREEMQKLPASLYTQRWTLPSSLPWICQRGSCIQKR